jgi:GNAT superfamily N-acetyltransferase
LTSELRPVRSPEDWRVLHQIRREVLFAPGRHSQPYDEQHPDDVADGNTPYLLLVDAEPLGTTRLDVRGPVAMVRLVAIVASHQRRGYGRLLSNLTDAEARRLGAAVLRVNAAPDAVGYYDKMGWKIEPWDSRELVGLAANCVQMTKAI